MFASEKLSAFDMTPDCTNLSTNSLFYPRVISILELSVFTVRAQN